MQTAAASPISIDRAEFPGMLATLCSYEQCFGPYHPQTLSLTAQLAIAFWRAGETGYARPLLERSVRDLGRYLGREQELRVQALAALRDLLLAKGDYGRAGAIQSEILECQVERPGSDDPETLATRAGLAEMLLRGVSCDSKKS
jgi:eukaryotic-like serine/threonine-protein kinase